MSKPDLEHRRFELELRKMRLEEKKHQLEVDKFLLEREVKQREQDRLDLTTEQAIAYNRLMLENNTTMLHSFERRDVAYMAMMLTTFANGIGGSGKTPHDKMLAEMSAGYQRFQQLMDVHRLKLRGEEVRAGDPEFE